MVNRNNNMYQRPEAIDPGFVDIAPLRLFNPEVAQMDMQNLGQAQQRYDASQNTIAKYIEDIGATPMSEQDKKFAYGKLQKDLDNIHEQVKTKGGDYSNYLPEIVKSLSKARSTLHLAKQRYEEEQKLVPILSKLQAEGKLLWENGVDPRTQSVFDEDGKYKGGLNYDFREQSNYDDIVNKGVVAGIDKLVREGSLIGSGYEGLLQQIQTQGLSALAEGKGVDKNIRDKFVKELAKGFKGEFERTSTWGIDDKMKSTYADKSENYIESAINRLAKDVQTKQYRQDPGYDPKKGSGDGLSNLTNIPMNVYSIVEDKGSVEKEINKIDELIKVFEKNGGKFNSESTPLTPEERLRLTTPGLQPSFNLGEQKEINGTLNQFNEFKSKYAKVYKYITENSGPINENEKNKQFLNYLKNNDLTTNTQKIAMGIQNPADIETNELFSKQLITSLSLQTELNEYNSNFKKTGKTVQASNIAEDKNASVFIRPYDGRVFIKSGGKTYGTPEIDITSLSEAQKTAFKLMQDISQKSISYGDDVENPIQSNVPFIRRFESNGNVIEKSVYPIFKWKINPKNLKERKLYETYNVNGEVLTENDGVTPIMREVNNWGEDVIGHLTSTIVGMTDPYGRKIQ